jgi:group I intron endonuclease
MSQNFNNGKIYKITNNINNEVYVGSTCDILRKRFVRHTIDMRNEKNKHRPLFKLMNELGTDIFRIDLIEAYPCDDKQALRQREGHWIRQIGTLNMKIEGRSNKEWKEENKDKYDKYTKEYREINKDKLKIKDKLYYEENKEKLIEGAKEYREKNREVIKEKKKIFRKNHAEEIINFFKENK